MKVNCCRCLNRQMEQKAITGCVAHYAYNLTDKISWIVCSHTKKKQINKKAFLLKNIFPLSRFWDIGLFPPVYSGVEWNFDCSDTEHLALQISITVNNQSISHRTGWNHTKKRISNENCSLFPLWLIQHAVCGSTPRYWLVAPQSLERKTWSKRKDLHHRCRQMFRICELPSHTLYLWVKQLKSFRYNSFSAFVRLFQDNTWTAMLTPLPLRNPAAAGRSNSGETPLATSCWTWWRI